MSNLVSDILDLARRARQGDKARAEITRRETIADLERVLAEKTAARDRHHAAALARRSTDDLLAYRRCRREIAEIEKQLAELRQE